MTEALNPGGPTYVNFTGEQVPDLARRSYPKAPIDGLSR